LVNKKMPESPLKRRTFPTVFRISYEFERNISISGRLDGFLRAVVHNQDVKTAELTGCRRSTYQQIELFRVGIISRNDNADFLFW